MELKFRDWLESVFGQPVEDEEPMPASTYPDVLNNGARPVVDLEPLPGNKKAMKKMKKQRKH